MYEFRIKEHWSHFLLLVQRIINYTIDGSIGTQPAHVIFRDMIDSDLAMDLPEGTRDQNPVDHLVKLREAQRRWPSKTVQAPERYVDREDRVTGCRGFGRVLSGKNYWAYWYRQVSQKMVVQSSLAWI